MIALIYTWYILTGYSVQHVHIHIFSAFLHLLPASEMTHEVVVEAGARDALEGMLNELESTDRREREMVTRAITALEPDGWRGVDHGLQDEASDRARAVLACFAIPYGMMAFAALHGAHCRRGRVS